MTHSRRRFTALVATLGASGIAGCSQQSNSSPASITEGSETARATPTATATAETEFDLPSGYSTDGISDDESVKEAHVSSLEGTTYSVSFYQGIETPSNEYAEAFDFPERTGHIVEVNMGAEWYLDGADGYIKLPESTDTDSDSFCYSTIDISADAWRDLAAGVLDFSVFHRLADYDYSAPTYTRTAGQRVAEFDVTGEKSGQLTVSSAGTIVDIDVESSEGPLIQYEISDVGETSVEEPDWVSDVETATSTSN